MPRIALLEKSRFSEAVATLLGGPWGPCEVEITKKIKNFDGLGETIS